MVFVLNSFLTQGLNQTLFFKEISGFYILFNLQFSRYFCLLLSVVFLSSNSHILSQAVRFVNNFFTFLNFFFFKRFSFALLLFSSVLYITMSIFVCQHVFLSFFENLFSKKERRKRDLNPRAGCPTYTLSRGASSAS